MKKIIGCFGRKFWVFLLVQNWVFSGVGSTVERSSTSDVIHNDPVAAGIADIAEALNLQPGSLDNTVVSLLQTIRSLKGFALSDVFHYIRELKNTLKVGTSISCSNFCQLLKEILLLWKGKFEEDVAVQASGIGMDEETLSEDMLDFAIAQHAKLKLEPDVFFKDLATKVVSKYDNIGNHEVDVTMKRLGQEIYTTVELLLCKMTWSALDNERIWFDIWELASLLYNVAKYRVIDEEDSYQDFFYSLRSRLIYFLNYSDNGAEDGKVGYQLPAMFFTQGLSFLDNELSFCPQLKLLSGELSTWVAKKLSQDKCVKGERRIGKLRAVTS
jgi:hypothetical protein